MTKQTKKTTTTNTAATITAAEAEAVCTRIYHRDGVCIGRVKRARTKTPLYSVGYVRLDGDGGMQTGGSNVGWLEAFANAGIGPEHLAVHLRAVRNGEPLPPIDPKCPSCGSRVRFDGERCFGCRYIAPDAKPWKPAPHDRSVEPSCPICSRTNAMLSSFDWTARETVLRCRDCDYAPNHPHVPAPWRFTRYYQGSVNNTTIVECEPDDLRVLVAAAKHEGTMGIMRSTDAKRHGEIVVMNRDGNTIARFSRAEAYAAQAIASFFAAAAQIERPAAVVKMCSSCASSGPTWQCRDCGAHCCEHRCGNKVGSAATCGACKRTNAALAPASETRPKAWHELPWSCGHDDAIRGSTFQECAICHERRYAPGFEPIDHPVLAPVFSSPAAAPSDDVMRVVRFEIKRKCAAGCGSDITYEVVAEFADCAPEISAKDGTRAYGGGHLCRACDVRIADALRGAKAVRS